MINNRLMAAENMPLWRWFPLSLSSSAARKSKQESDPPFGLRREWRIAAIVPNAFV
jgi:hypothetical protein